MSQPITANDKAKAKLLAKLQKNYGDAHNELKVNSDGTLGHYKASGSAIYTELRRVVSSLNEEMIKHGFVESPGIAAAPKPSAVRYRDPGGQARTAQAISFSNTTPSFDIFGPLPEIQKWFAANGDKTIMLPHGNYQTMITMIKIAVRVPNLMKPKDKGYKSHPNAGDVAVQFTKQVAGSVGGFAGGGDPTSAFGAAGEAGQGLTDIAGLVLDRVGIPHKGKPKAAWDDAIVRDKLTVQVIISQQDLTVHEAYEVGATFELKTCDLLDDNDQPIKSSEWDDYNERTHTYEQAGFAAVSSIGDLVVGTYIPQLYAKLRG